MNLVTEISGSFCLDARELHHLGPLLGFVGDELAKLCRRHRHRCAAHFAEAPAQSRIGQYGVYGFVEFGNDFWRSALRRHDPIPDADFITPCLSSMHCTSVWWLFPVTVWIAQSGSP